MVNARQASHFVQRQRRRVADQVDLSQLLFGTLNAVNTGLYSAQVIKVSVQPFVLGRFGIDVWSKDEDHNCCTPARSRVGYRPRSRTASACSSSSDRAATNSF